MFGRVRENAQGVAGKKCEGRRLRQNAQGAAGEVVGQGRRRDPGLRRREGRSARQPAAVRGGGRAGAPAAAQAQREKGRRQGKKRSETVIGAEHKVRQAGELGDGREGLEEKASLLAAAVVRGQHHPALQ